MGRLHRSYMPEFKIRVVLELISGKKTLGKAPKMPGWLNEQETRLFQRHAGEIAALLRQEAQLKPPVADGLLREAGYFETNHRRMHYMHLREDGWVIGSGMVESGCKRFKARLAGPGMRWSRSGAERLLPIRAAIMGDQFDRIWRAVYNSPPN